MGNIFLILTRQTFNNEEKVNKVKNITFNWSSAAGYFKGRTETLATIQECFATNKIVVIHGTPGIGKTETARKFGVHKTVDFQGNLIWISAETETNIQKCFENLAKSLHLHIPDPSQVYGKFRSSRCLFVFDNVENMASISKYLPDNELHPTVNILITSQFSQWDSPVCVKVPLKPLSVEDSLAIFKDKLKDKYHDSKIFKDLVEYLEGIPLSIQIVSSLINQEFRSIPIKKSDLNKIIPYLKENFINLNFPNSEANDYKESVISSISSALNRLNDQYLNLLSYMAYLDADYISHKDLLFLPSIGKSEEKLRRALNELEDYSLIQVERDNKDRLKIAIHRTIQLVLRKYDLNKQKGSMFKTTLEIILSYQMFAHFDSIFKYVKEAEFRDKSVEFYYENTTLANSYLFTLVHFHCDVLLKKLLPIFDEGYSESDNYNKVLNKKFITIYCDMVRVFFLLIYGEKVTFSLNITKTGYNFNISSEEGPFWFSIQSFDRFMELNNSENVINSQDFLDGRTILHLLVQLCNYKNIEETITYMDDLILENNADISIRDKNNNTILHTACNKYNICFQIIKYLVEKQKCKNLVNTQNEWNETPLQVLFQYNNQNSDLCEMVSYFIKECEADITIEDNLKWNTLFYVCRYGTSQTINFVLKTRNCRQFINTQDMEGNVAFTQLIYNNRIQEQEIIELIDLFIVNKMNFKIRNNENQTLVEIAELNEFMTLSDELMMELESSFFYRNSCNLM